MLCGKSTSAIDIGYYLNTSRPRISAAVIRDLDSPSVCRERRDPGSRAEWIELARPAPSRPPPGSATGAGTQNGRVWDKANINCKSASMGVSPEIAK